MKERTILSNKVYLYLTEFFAGMSVMAVELGASRLLAPYFSSSQIVWTIIIGTIMIAMALGNIYGGRFADKNPDPDRLYSRILIASIWIALIPVVGKYVILGISALLIFTVNSNFLIWAGFLACMVIFVFPLFLLGTVTPSLVKYTVDSLSDSGKTVGMLNASNTIGSILGTFLPTFVTIPAVGTSITFLIFAGILLLLTIVYFAGARRNGKRIAAGILIFLLCCVTGYSDSFAFWEDNLAYEGESIYNYLQVKEDEEKVILSTNVLFGVQSMMTKDDSLTGMYYDYALAAPLMAGAVETPSGHPSMPSGREVETPSGHPSMPSGREVETPSGHPSMPFGGEVEKEQMQMLILGNGTGTYATQCSRYFDQMQIEGVEIDEKITDLAGKYFELPADMNVVTYDGRAYLNVSDQKYDVIMVDAYQDITIPFQMSSIEFFTLVRDHLKEDGVMVVNMNMRGREQGNTSQASPDAVRQEQGNLNQYLSDTIAAVFDEVYTVDVSGSTNRELFAANSGKLLSNFSSGRKTISDPELSDMMERVSEQLTEYEAGNYRMTDDKAPVELLGMQIIDDLITDELGYYKKIFEKEGISGLLNAM